jgi:serine/threonine protein phosphatase 1
MSRTFVIGDIHGAYRALLQCLERSAFQYEHDHLICLGDVCDGWPETKTAVDELLKIKNLTYLLGNHDFWALEWMREGAADDIWLQQGGDATVHSYGKDIPIEHIEFFERAELYFVLNKKLFVHAGVNTRLSVEQQSTQTLLWDRNFARTALDLHAKSIEGSLTEYDEVYIGHTPVSPPPVHACEVWLMDTGAGWSGVLSMMNIDTKEVFQSDPVPQLYPGVEGRRKR